MFEIGIFSVIVLAVSYWAVLWVMGRREDVLHGEFVKGDARPSEPATAVAPAPKVRPVFPDPVAAADRPVFPDRPQPSKPPVVAKQPAYAERIESPEPALETVVPAQPAFRPERMEQLLASIKQDLNQLVQK